MVFKISNPIFKIKKIVRFQKLLAVKICQVYIIKESNIWSKNHKRKNTWKNILSQYLWDSIEMERLVTKARMTVDCC